MRTPVTFFLLVFALTACGGSDSADGGLDAAGDAGRGDAVVPPDATGDAPVTGDAADGSDAGGDGAACTDDGDHDGHRSPACGGDDCDDSDPNAYPGNPERCDTLGHDEDCDPSTLGPDADSDGYVSAMCCDTQPSGTLACGSDCNDMEANVHPGAPEACNGIDDDCDGMVDDHGVLLTFFRDVDGDGYGDTSMSMMACTAPLGYVLTGGDCDDVHASVHPGLIDGPTANCDGLDNDCDGTPDRGCPCIDGHVQACGLSSTAPCRLGTQTCAGAAWGACMGDVEPMPEVCNGLDDDCNGVVDDGTTVICYADSDGDGYAPTGAPPMSLCGDSLHHCPAGYTANAPSSSPTTDCDDAHATVHPGAIEACNSVDDNCNGIVDDGAGTLQYRDVDGDGYGVASTTMTSCVTLTGYATRAGDCDDGDPAIHPGAEQACGSTVDGDCDGLVGAADPDASTWCATRPNGRALGGTPYCDDFGCQSVVCDYLAQSPATMPWASNCNGANSDRVDDEDGCETMLGTVANCSHCGDMCTAPTPRCVLMTPYPFSYHCIP